jgi:hypothetical protein
MPLGRLWKLKRFRSIFLASSSEFWKKKKEKVVSASVERESEEMKLYWIEQKGLKCRPDNQVYMERF